MSLRDLRRWVLATDRLPPFRLFYRGVYALAVWTVRLWARSESNAHRIVAHRGWASGDWRPGVSDIDLIVEAKSLEGERGASWIGGLVDRYAAWKKTFPFLGEFLVTEAADTEAFLAHGGVRAAELRASAIVLEGPPISDTDKPPTFALSQSIERLHAHTRLMSWSLASPNEDASVRRAQFRKAAIDLLRYSEGEPVPPPSRNVFFENLSPSRKKAWAPMLEGSEESPLSSVAGCVAFHHRTAADLLERHPLQSLGVENPPEDSDPEGIEQRDNHLERFDSLRREAGEALLGTCEDNLFRTYLIVADGAASIEDLLPVLKAVRRTWEGASRTTPIVLTETLWRLWSRLPYLEDPTLHRFSTQEGNAGLFSVKGSPSPRVFSFGLPKDTADFSTETRKALLEAAWANLKMTWRSMAFPGSGDALAVRHFLLGRTAGLRLLRAGFPSPPFFLVDSVLREHAKRFPLSAPPPDGEDWNSLFSWVDARLRDVD